MIMRRSIKQDKNMTNATLINYTTMKFISKPELDLYIQMQEQLLTPDLISKLTTAGMLRRTTTKVWNKDGAHIAAVLYEYKDPESYKACQPILEDELLSKLTQFNRTFSSTRGVVTHEIISEEYVL